jgi:hypothetical protein
MRSVQRPRGDGVLISGMYASDVRLSRFRPPRVVSEHHPTHKPPHKLHCGCTECQAPESDASPLTTAQCVPRASHALHTKPDAPPSRRRLRPVLSRMPSLAAAHIATQSAACLLFALALASCACAVRTLCAVRFSAFTRAHWTLLAVCIATTLVGALSAVHTLRHMLSALVRYAGSGGALAALDNMEDPMNILNACPFSSSEEPSPDLDAHRP